jgi:hypothetical protein
MSISIGEQLACAKREVAMRKGLYPKWVAGERMTQAKADQEIAAMEAIVATLEREAARERLRAEPSSYAWSDEQLAEMVQVTREAVAQYRRDMTLPREELLARLGKMFEP